MNEEDPPPEEGIELYVIGGAPPKGFEPVREEVYRLTKTGVEGARKVEYSAQSADLHQPAEQERQRRLSRQWMLVLSAGVMFLLVAGVAWFMNSRGSGKEQEVRYERVYEDGTDPDDPFIETADAYLTTMQDRLRALIGASAEEAVPLIRQGERRRALVLEHWEAPQLDEQALQALEMMLPPEYDGLPYIGLVGKDLDGAAASFLFVLEEGEWRYDWVASVGLNDPGLEEFRGSAKGAEADLRLVLQPDVFYTSFFPESEFLSLRIRDTYEDCNAWAFVRRDSELIDRVRQHLNRGGDFGGASAPGSLLWVVRLRNEGHGNQRQFELIDLVSEDWIVEESN